MDKRRYSQKHIAVIGFGKTGRALLDYFLDHKLYKSLCLFNDTPLDSPALKQARTDYEARGVTFLIGSDAFAQLENVDIILFSPGVDGRAERFQKLRDKGIVFLSEIECAASFIEAPIIAVTGTNGKSTTVSLIHHFLSRNGFNSFLTGNIGTPLISEVKNISADAVVVVELSSFQLEEIVDFKPHIALILNVTPDHLNRYKDMDDYFAAKLNIGRNQDAGDYMILNADDPLLASSADAAGKARTVWFSRKLKEVETGAVSAGGVLQLKLPGVAGQISLEGNPLRGVHNLENLLAAAAAAALMGAPASDIETCLRDFKGLEHRMESVGTIGNVEFINDSKATNVDAALKSVTGMDKPVVLILGGKNKGGDFTLLTDTIRRKADRVLLVGDAADTIRRQLKELEPLLTDAADFDEAVAVGYERLKEHGGVVLLAPGCASFDMFDNFEHRGRAFAEAVEKLEGTGVGNG